MKYDTCVTLWTHSNNFLKVKIGAYINKYMQALNNNYLNIKKGVNFEVNSSENFLEYTNK